jgi:hypothetical protein
MPDARNSGGLSLAWRLQLMTTQELAKYLFEKVSGSNPGLLRAAVPFSSAAEERVKRAGGGWHDRRSWANDFCAISDTLCGVRAPKH